MREVPKDGRLVPTDEDFAALLFARRMRARVGSYAKTVLYHSQLDHVCPVCGGPKKAEYPRCGSCASLCKAAYDAGGVDLLADRVRIAYYAVKYDQMYRVVDGYKRDDRREAGEYLTTMKYMLGNALAIHRPCLERLADGVPPTSWAVIPSTKGSSRYGRPHPLEALVVPIMDGYLPQVRLQAVGAKQRRSVRPDMFDLQGSPDARMLRHVLLIDDTWTTGGNVESAAAMLKRHGAEQVTVFCVARVIDLHFCTRAIGRDVTKGYQRLRYHYVCPWTGKPCDVTLRLR